METTCALPSLILLIECERSHTVSAYSPSNHDVYGGYDQHSIRDVFGRGREAKNFPIGVLIERIGAYIHKRKLGMLG